MRASRILALSGLALLVCLFLVACGGGGSTSTPPAGPPTITSTILPQASVNVGYSFYMQATGGSGTYTWAITKGSLPPGLTFNDMTAQISGTPTTLGTYLFTVQVTDSKNLMGTSNVKIIVGGALLIDCNSCVQGTTLPFGSPGVPYSATLSVSGGVAPYTWCVLNQSGACDPTQSELPPGLSLSTASNGDAIISGTPTNVPAIPPQFTLQVTDSEVPAAVSTEPLTMTIIGIEPASLPAGTTNVLYSQTLTVLGGQRPYTWSITTGSLPPGLSLSGNCNELSTCTISGTPTTAGSYPFTMQVKDGAPPPLTATATVQYTLVVDGITNGALKGNYVFSFSGYSNGTPVMMLGAFAADGNGNITGGDVDLNNGSGEANTGCFGGPQPQTITPAPSSVYSLGASGQGLGTITIVTNSATYNFTISIRSDGSGSLIQDNADPHTRGSGTIALQTPGVQIGQFNNTSLALGMVGTDPSGNRYAAAGQMRFEDNQGDFDGPALDINDGGTLTSQTTFGGTLEGELDGFGRGCYGIITPHGYTGPPHYYAYYVVSLNQLLFVSTDAVPGDNSANLTLSSALRQGAGASGFNNANLASPTVVELTARDSNGAADVTTGLFVGQGTSSHTCPTQDNATLTFDENGGGNQLGQQPLTASGTYCVDASTGRVTLDGFTGWSTSPPVLYLGGTEPGVVVGTDAVVTFGTVEGQTGGPYTTASFTGGFWGGTFLPAIPGITDSVASLLADGNGTLTGTEYTSGPGGPGGPTNLTLTYSLDSTGRGVVKQNGNTYGISYLVSVETGQYSSKFILLPAGSDPALNVFVGPPSQ